MKPTPAKSHYTFNLRDFSKVICGICLCTNKEVPKSDVVMRLWAHETTRVFGDRLINNQDIMWLIDAIKECVSNIVYILVSFMIMAILLEYLIEQLAVRISNQTSIWTSLLFQRSDIFSNYLLIITITLEATYLISIFYQ